MVDPSLIDDFAKGILEKLPTGLKAFQEDIEKNIRAVASQTFSKMDLVTREEFDIQSAVLQRTREKLETLEQLVASLEKDNH